MSKFISLDGAGYTWKIATISLPPVHLQRGFVFPINLVFLLAKNTTVYHISGFSQLASHSSLVSGVFSFIAHEAFIPRTLQAEYFTLERALAWLLNTKKIEVPQLIKYVVKCLENILLSLTR